LLVWQNPLFAKDISGLKPGDIVRVFAPTVRAEPIEGTIESLDEDTLTLKVEGQEKPLSFPVSAIARIEISQGKIFSQEKFLRGAGVGFIVAAGLTYIFEDAASMNRDIRWIALGASGGALLSGCYTAGGKSMRKYMLWGSLGGITAGLAGVILLHSSLGLEMTPASALYCAAILGGAAGALVGLAAGVLAHKKWKEVPLQNIRADFGFNRRGGVALRVTFSF
jgi:hypothetical protein